MGKTKEEIERCTEKMIYCIYSCKNKEQLDCCKKMVNESKYISLEHKLELRKMIIIVGIRNTCKSALIDLRGKFTMDQITYEISK